MSTWNTSNNENQQWQNAPAPSPWDNFETIDAAPQRNGYLPPGIDAPCKIVEMKMIQSIKNNNRPVFIATVEIEDEGETRRFDWVAKADERPYLQNIKSLVLALNPGAPSNSFGRELMEELTGPSQPARGTSCHVRTETIQTRSGHDFTKVYWSPAR